MSGPGAGGSQTASAVLGDVVSAMTAAPDRPRRRWRYRCVEDVECAFYVHMEVDDRPGRARADRAGARRAGASIKSVVQRGAGERARS